MSFKGISFIIEVEYVNFTPPISFIFPHTFTYCQIIFMIANIDFIRPDNSKTNNLVINYSITFCRIIPFLNLLLLADKGEKIILLVRNNFYL